MNEPNVRVVVLDVPTAERKLGQLLRERRRVERMAEDARRALAKIDRDLERLERQLRRARPST